ncbi:heterokaryon incompatibility protein-domain-containing protein [Schizothecium vesticola]|uniref:Heterokaryon incompatibility protein-domain-containing protein n=1 Tax=Schizothecium vesticola TaxID=314040 RepID=A0AA40KCE6_9PEZI|nr:heterokaryon incompatibility protein-domain-containing protein [Schizothecium vesticola]
MRLLHTTTFELRSFLGEEKPPYAILSHTWGDDEVLYEDARGGSEKLQSCEKAGLSKVLTAAQKARGQKLHYIWIDTCCIDKSSSAELSEAINSMFAWYADAVICYAFLSDYTSLGGQDFEDELKQSRWFYRGWTLQELIAPFEVDFYDSTWSLFGNRFGLSAAISRITGIDESFLQAGTSCRHGHNCVNIRNCNDCQEGVGKRRIHRQLLARRLKAHGISSRMSWASRRSTTRPENIAYCLLGIFSVNMPLLYGEGGARAFQRLQQEIGRHSPDHTLLAWHGVIPYDRDSYRASFLGLAPSPLAFHEGHLFRPLQGEEGLGSMTLFGKGFNLDVYLSPSSGIEWSYLDHRSFTLRKRTPKAVETASGLWIAILNCTARNDYFTSPALIVEKTALTSNSFKRFNFNKDLLPRQECIARIAHGSNSCQVLGPGYQAKHFHL